MQEHIEVQQEKTDYRIIPRRSENINKPPIFKKEIKNLVACKCCHSKTPKSLVSNNGLRLYECDKCGFIFSSSDNIKTIEYNLKYPVKVTSLETKEYLKRAVEWLPKKSLNILNVGLDDLHLIDVFNRKGHKVISVENLQELFKLNRTSLEKNIKYDVILTCNSLSHIAEPILAFKKLFNMLSEYGLHVIYMDMHTTKEELIKRFKNTELKKPVPLSYFRFQTIERIMDKLGHDIVYVNPKMIMVRKGV